MLAGAPLECVAELKFDGLAMGLRYEGGVLVQAESMMSNATAIERHLAGLDREMAGIVRVANEMRSAGQVTERVLHLCGDCRPP